MIATKVHHTLDVVHPQHQLPQLSWPFFVSMIVGTFSMSVKVTFGDGGSPCFGTDGELDDW